MGQLRRTPGQGGLRPLASSPRTKRGVGMEDDDPAQTQADRCQIEVLKAESQ
jgi:hypothetical protein